MKKYYLLFVTLLLNSSIALSDLKTTVEQATTDYISSHFLNASFMFADEQNILEMGAKGLRSLDGKQLKATEIMPIASATKPVTAVAILKLQDRGMLNVRYKIEKYLGKDSGIWKNGKVPDFAKKITLHHLLTHTSGLAEYIPDLKIDTSMTHDQINKEIANFAASKPLESKPGEKYKYTNTNFVLLGLIIERVSGQKLSDFFDKEFFIPLAMKNTHLASLEEALKIQINPESMSYPIRYFVIPTGDKPRFVEAKVDFMFVPYADGGIISNNEDLITWHRALHQGKLLSPKSYKMMTTKYVAVDTKAWPKKHIGYGLFISELENGDVMFHHSGNAVAIRSESGYIPNKHLYFSILSNVMIHIPEEQKSNIDLNNPKNHLDIIYFKEAILKAI